MEKLVELLAGCPCESDCEGMVGSCPHRKNGNCNEIFKLSYCAVSKLAQHLIANGVTVQEWISVKERLPEESGMYIVTANDGHAQRVSFVQWQKKNRMWNLNGARSYWRVTHWMPMPEPPKEGVENG